ncbi:MAG: hypothetical protein QOD03_1355 [Verrucomicrobiota bacterium]|jgi:hypothetical protein
MKKIFTTAAAALVVFAAPWARAWTYTDGDALLIFRESGFNTVEFNIGNIIQFTSLSPGTTIPVNGWSSSLVTSTFGTDLTGVSVIVASTTSSFAGVGRASWLTGADPSEVVTENGTASSWQSKFWSPINAIGTKPILNVVTPTLTNAYSIDLSSVDWSASYDYIVTAGGTRASQIALFGGNASFDVEGVVPGSFALWRIAPNVNAAYVGTFNITANGVLTFTAGPLVVATPPIILSIGRTNAVNTVSFTTTSGGNYWLAYTNALGGSISNWPIISGPVSGDGSNKSLNHTSADANGFYRVVRTP